MTEPGMPKKAWVYTVEVLGLLEEGASEICSALVGLLPVRVGFLEAECQ